MVKKTLRLAVPPTLCALARHLYGTCISSWTHKSPCVSLQVHLLFTCSSLIHMSFNCGSLGQQSFQWMLHNWLIRVWRPAATKHWVKLLFSAKTLPMLLSRSSSRSDNPGFLSGADHCGTLEKPYQVGSSEGYQRLKRCTYSSASCDFGLLVPSDWAVTCSA